MSNRNCTTWGLVLAGGRGTRVDGHDKGLLNWQGKPIISHVLAAVAPQTDRVLISCNRNAGKYRDLGYQTIPDITTDYRGPLAAVQAARSHLPESVDYLFISPCDTPYIPLDVVSRLHDAPGEHRVRYVHDGDRSQYLHALIPTHVLDRVDNYLELKRKSVAAWYEEMDACPVDFSDERLQFRNLNSIEDFADT